MDWRNLTNGVADTVRQMRDTALGVITERQRDSLPQAAKARADDCSYETESSVPRTRHRSVPGGKKERPVARAHRAQRGWWREDRS